MSNICNIKRALISVYDKSGLIELATFLHEKNVHMISTGKTATYLRENGFNVSDVSSLTKFQEILNGRVKTLHPHVHAGILFNRKNNQDVETMQSLDLPSIDLVVVNLYPFESVMNQADNSAADLVEMIDIGGPTMLRAGAKNHDSVCVLHDPKTYQDFMKDYQENDGVSENFRIKRAISCFKRTSQYDQCIVSGLQNKYQLKSEEENFNLNVTKTSSLRYGENPQQSAAVFASSQNTNTPMLAQAKSISGKELSYNNFLDMHAAVHSLRCLIDNREDNLCGAIVIKHGIPCGAALNQNAAKAISTAIECDKKSAFGGIISCSHTIDEDSAAIISQSFFEVVVAPGFTESAKNILTKKKNLRLVPLKNILTGNTSFQQVRSIYGGYLIQDSDPIIFSKDQLNFVSEKKPNDDQIEAMMFASRLSMATPSNAICIASKDQLMGVGAGQPNRVQSVELAINAAKNLRADFSLLALASDAFFPFADSIEQAASAGIKTIVQPGGSIRDQEVIDRANQLGLAMAFTGTRHFKH